MRVGGRGRLGAGVPTHTGLSRRAVSPPTLPTFAFAFVAPSLGRVQHRPVIGG